MSPSTAVLCVLLSLAIVLGCAPEYASNGDNISSEDYVYAQPQATDSPIRVSTLAAENIDEAEIVSIVKDILDSRYGGIDSILIARNGALVLEQYFNGYHRNKKHDIRSATKSITGLLTGIAIDKGYLADADVTIYDYFTRYDHFDYWSNLKNDITVQHLLTMSGGWECDDHNSSSIGKQDRMYRYKDWAKFILDLPMENQPGQVFSYCSGAVGLLGDVISSASRMDVADFAQQYLFGPLGITEFHYVIDPSNRTHVGGLMHLTPLGMLKVGQLFLDDGNWGGNQIVSSQWIAESKTPYFRWYSNLWWIWSGTVAAIDTEVTFYYASGNGGQTISIVPAYDLVVVFTAHEYDSPAAGNGLWLLINRIIPSVARGNG